MSNFPCRLCLDYDRSKIDIFDQTNNKNECIANSITKLFSFKVNSSDKLRKICMKCAQLVNEFDEFYTLVADTQAYLAKTILDNVNVFSSRKNIFIEKNDPSVDNIKFYKPEIKSEMFLLDDLHVINNPAIKKELFENKDETNKINITHRNKYVNASNFASRSKCEGIDNDEYVCNNLKSTIQDTNLKSTGAIPNGLIQKITCDITLKKRNLSKLMTTASESIIQKKTYGTELKTTDLDELPDCDNYSIDELQHSYDEEDPFYVENDEFPTEVMKDGEFILKGYRLHGLVAKYFKLCCEICPTEQKFTNFYQMCRHYKTAHDTKGYVTCCGKKFKAWDETKCHMVYHLQPSALQCLTCKVNFPTGTALKRHGKVHLPESEKIHKCDDCGRGWADDKALRQHKRSHLPYDERYPHKCQVCNKSFTKYGLKNHNAQVHEKKVGDFLCPTCGRNFHNRIAMEHHLSSHDVTGEMSVICKVCDMVLKNRFTLKQHMKQHGDKLKHCSLCSFSTYRTGPLTVHMRVKHSDIKPYECKQCDKKFKLKSCLDTHMVQHTGEKKYSCAYCPKTFATSGNHSLHRKRIHLEEYMNDTRVKKKHIYKFKPNLPDVPTKDLQLHFEET